MGHLLRELREEMGGQSDHDLELGGGEGAEAINSNGVTEVNGSWGRKEGSLILDDSEVTVGRYHRNVKCATGNGRLALMWRGHGCH